MLKTEWKRPQKDKARKFAITPEKIDKGIFVFLTAEGCYDIKEGLENGTLTADDHVIAINNDKNICKEIKVYLKNNFNKYNIICSNIQDIDFSKYTKEQKISFMFLDLCGIFNADIFYWLNKNKNNFSMNSRICTTVKAFYRASKFIPIIQEHTEKYNNEYELEILLEDTKQNLTKHISGLNIDINNVRTKILKEKMIRYTNVIKSIKGNLNAFLIALNNKNISINRIYRYKDDKHSEMVLFDFYLNGEKYGNDNVVKHIMNLYNSKVSYNNRVKLNVNDVKKKGIEVAQSIAEKLDLYSFKSYNAIPRGKKAWITIEAKKRGDDPKSVRAGIKATFSKMKNKKKKKK